MVELHDAMVLDPAISSPPLPSVNMFYYSQERQINAASCGANTYELAPGMMVMMGLKKKDEVL
ncbi:hypothetical protein Lal_00034130 [Lupinus albus]|nr:hypothetical protein Lal_00034130 [Lupinus albus]